MKLWQQDYSKQICLLKKRNIQDQNKEHYTFYLLIFLLVHVLSFWWRQYSLFLVEAWNLYSKGKNQLHHSDMLTEIVNHKGKIVKKHDTGKAHHIINLILIHYNVSYVFFTRMSRKNRCSTNSILRYILSWSK